MRNVILRGGRPVGPPAGWNAEENGECLTLSVLFSAPNYPDMHTVTTAWTFDDAELHALHQGGAFFLSATLPFVPLQRLWTQDAAGHVVGELVMSEHGVQPVEPGSDALALRRAIETAAALRAAIIAVGRSLAGKVGGDTSDRFWLGADNAGIVQQLAALVGRVSARSSIVGIPLLTLDDIAAGNVGKGRPFPGEPVDAATQTELETRLGVQLNIRVEPDADLEPTAGMRGPFAAWQSTIEPDRWYVGNDRVAYFATEIGASGEAQALLVASLLNAAAEPNGFGELATEKPARDWLKIARAAGECGVRYRTNSALCQFLDAVTGQSATVDQVNQAAAVIVENQDGDFVASFANPILADMFVSGGGRRYRLRESPPRG